MVTKCFPSLAFMSCILFCLSVWSNISLCCGAVGNSRFLLEVHPKEQTVCYSSWCSATYSQEDGTDGLHPRKFKTIHIHYTPAVIMIIYSEMLITAQHPFFSRMFPATPGCDQQGSGCSSSRHLLPHPPSLIQMAAPLVTIGCHWLLPLQWGKMHHLDTAACCHGNTGSRCCGNRLFMISSNEIARNTSLQLSCCGVWETEKGRGLSRRM